MYGEPDLDLKMKTVQVLGQRKHRLKVIEQIDTGKKGDRYRLRCLCDCGKETVIRKDHFTLGKTRSCGCLKGGKLELGEASFNRLYYSYKQGAKHRSLTFALSEVEFRILTKQNCHYCGTPPSKTFKYRNGFGEYLYNGVDRIDNEKGYTVENSVACCSICNSMKSSLDKERFVAQIARIAAHQSGLKNSA